jgi:hypothetical protein
MDFRKTGIDAGVSTQGISSKDAASQKDHVAGDNELPFTFNPAEITTDAFETVAEVPETISDALSQFYSNNGDALGRMAMRLKESAPKLINTDQIPEGLTAEEFSDDNVKGLLASRPAHSYSESIRDNAILRLFKDMDEMNIGTTPTDDDDIA